MNDFSFVDEELAALEKANLRRDLKIIITANGPWVELANGKRVLQFASNSYLGLGNHPDLISASNISVSKYGTSSTGSRLLSGTLELHTYLEDRIADFQNTESAIFFGSGYLANIGVMSSLISRDDAVYSDELNHASIIDGIRLSNATKFIYNHNDVNHLEKLIVENKDKYKRNYIVTDTVFGMNGDLAPLSDIAKLVEKYNCIPIVDEAHAIGVFGNEGSGLISEYNLGNYFKIRIGTCSKAVGAEGAFCVAPENVIELLKNKARTFMFSTAPSPQVVGAVLKGLDLVRDSDWRREKLWENSKRLYSGLNKNPKLKLCQPETPIIIIYFKTIEVAFNVSKKLLEEYQVWAPAIRPPTVKTPLIRLSPISTHTDEDIDYTVKAFERVSKDIPVEPLTV